MKHFISDGTSHKIQGSSLHGNDSESDDIASLFPIAPGIVLNKTIFGEIKGLDFNDRMVPYVHVGNTFIMFSMRYETRSRLRGNLGGSVLAPELPFIYPKQALSKLKDCKIHRLKINRSSEFPEKWTAWGLKVGMSVYDTLTLLQSKGFQCITNSKEAERNGEIYKILAFKNPQSLAIEVYFRVEDYQSIFSPDTLTSVIMFVSNTL